MKSKSVLMAAGALAVAAGFALGVSPAVRAGEGGSDRVQLASAEQMAAVKERQELMKENGRNAKTIAEFLKASTGTKEEAQSAAAEIGERAKRIPEAFKVEASLSEMDAVGKNRAKPEIWTKWDDFVANAKILEEKAAALVSAFQSGDSAAIQAAFGDMGKNGCGHCHDDFQGPEVN